MISCVSYENTKAKNDNLFFNIGVGVMKKNYVTPAIVAENFVADESVSSCFYIECSYAPGRYNGQNHSEDSDGTGCGWKQNQAITVVSGDINDPAGATISIKELNVKINNQHVGTRQCYFVGSEGATTGRSSTLSGVNHGEEIYWVTNVGLGGFTVWMPHKGTVNFQDASHPNRS